MKTVLFAEDHPDVQTIVRAALRGLPCHVQTVSTVEDGLAAIAAGVPDLLLLDLRLPDGSGYQLLEALRERSSVPAIVLSAFATEADQTHGLDAGADVYLSKPFDVANLRQLVASHLDLQIEG